jgi:hypothetical protein
MTRGRLVLGPIVGHTEEDRTRIWINVDGDFDQFSIRVKNKGNFKVKSTESEFGTAIAEINGLKADTTYKYDVTYKRKVLQGSSGSFTTMPPKNSFAKITFVSLSCNTGNEIGAWNQLADFISKAKPKFLIMMGDQIYLDGDAKNIWKEHLDSKPAVRRKAMADMYEKIWSQEPIRTIMKNIPTYMMWDDGDIRNGWGSYAFDSPTLSGKYHRGQNIFKKSYSYFTDARDLFYHFQYSHNPDNPMKSRDRHIAEQPEDRGAMPFFFYCGRLAVLVIDSRGVRDLWRNSNPILGDKQWKFIKSFLDNLGSDRQVDALAVVTPTPIVATSPSGFQQKSLGHRVDDINYFMNGDEINSFDLLHRSSSSWHFLELLYNRYTGASVGNYQLNQLGDVRSQWSHKLSTKEQSDLIREASQVLSSKRKNHVKQVTFIGGDLHIGGKLKIMVDDMSVAFECLVTSGISATVDLKAPTVPAFYDENFHISKDIRVKLDLIVRDFNFGVTQVIFSGDESKIINDVVHKGWANYWKLTLPLD